MTDKELLSWMKLNYDKFNKLYFNGVLPNVNMKLSTAKHRVGYAQCKQFSDSHREYSIFFSKYFEMPEEELVNVLLHEMIHISEYFFHLELFTKKNGRRSYKPHGDYFMSELERLNSFGHHITVKSESKEVKVSEYALNKLKEKYLIILIHRKDEYVVFKLPKKISKEEINFIFNCFEDSDKKYLIETDYSRFASSRGSKTKYWVITPSSSSNIYNDIMTQANSKILEEK